MAKRRRERDKPKSGPEALYNPNKRVLLSYASDEEEEEAGNDATAQAPVIPAEPAVDERTLANYQMDEYPDTESEVGLGAAVDEDVEVSAREEDDADEADESIAPAATQERGIDDWGSRARRDPATNQWPTLGPVSYGEDEDEEEEYDPETEEAMAYLRAVQSERQTIPEILSAPRQLQADADHLQDLEHRNPDGIHIKNDDNDDTAAFVQVAPLEQTSTPAEDDARDPQKVFTRLLVERFLEQRTQLHLPPSVNALSELPDSCPVSFPRGNHKATTEWYHLLSTKAPLPAQLRSMDQETVVNLLELVQKQHLPTNCKMSKFTSAWIWSLLARLDDVGTMTNDEVFPIRELGKRAVFVLLSLTSPQLAAGLQSLEKEQEDSVSSTESDHAQPAQATPPTDNTLATLDMMLVVIGETFGQKDLLEFRPKWTTTEKPV